MALAHGDPSEGAECKYANSVIITGATLRPRAYMGTRPGRQAASDVKITLRTLDQYYNSIQEPFRETRKGWAEEAAGKLGIFVTVFVFSLIPLIPYALSKLASWVLPLRVFVFRGIHFQPSSFFLWWLTCFVVSLSLLVCVSKFSGERR